MKESMSVRLLYGTSIGRSVLKILVNPGISKIAGLFLDSKFSKFLIPIFIKSNNINIKEADIPEGGFASFNAFFTRKVKRPVKEVHCDELVSPCDAYLSCIKIEKDSIFDIKHTRFTVRDLLRDKKLADEFNDGYALIFRLTPAHYHRYCFSSDGRIVCNRKIKGILHCVRPIATRQIPVFARNAREYQVIDTKHFGRIVQMEIGALMVGKITNHPKEVPSSVKVMEEKGYFEFGGSTIILLVQKNKIELVNELFKDKNSDGEVSVKQGMVIAKESIGNF